MKSDFPEVVSITAEAPVLQKMADKDKWAYKEDWSAKFVFDDGGGTLHVNIKKGYWTDLASVPRPLRGAFDNGSGDFPVLIASQAHDMFYSTHFLSKDFADLLFYRVLRFYGVSYLKAKAYFLAVHWFGDSAWEYLSESEKRRDRRLCSISWGDK